MPTPEYILSLREKIGHDLLWLPGATAVVLHEGRILLGRRADNGNWAPITGLVDPGEEPAAAAVRECLEEAGVVCEVEGLAGVKAGGEVVFPNGDRCRFLDHTFRCRYVSGTARVTVNDTVTLLTENQSVYVPLGAVHRLENPGKVPMVLIEVQTGAYLGEDDIIRYDDVYARN